MILSAGEDFNASSRHGTGIFTGRLPAERPMSEPRRNSAAMSHADFPATAVHNRRSASITEERIPASLPPCQTLSPLGINYARMIALLHAGKEIEACREWRRHTPFGSLLAFLGDPYGENACASAARSRSFPLLHLLRDLAERHPDILHLPFPDLPRSGRKAAVIGSGPAGLQAAWTLHEHGFSVTLYEAAPVAGITLVRPPLRESDPPGLPLLPAVPAEIVSRTMLTLTLSGITIRTSSPVGQAELSRLTESHDVVLCACGKGAVLPADPYGRVGQNLFAAGTCVKNKKHLGLPEALVSGRHAAETAFRTLEGLSLPETPPSVPTAVPSADEKEQTGEKEPDEPAVPRRKRVQDALAECLCCLHSDRSSPSER